MTKSEILMADFNKKFKTNLFSHGTIVHNVTRIPFSSPRANYMLYGGIPRGRLVEFAGPENSGKTTSSLDIVKNAQKLFKQEWEDEISTLESYDKPTKAQIERLTELRNSGPKKCLWVDCENTFDPMWARILGVTVAELDFMVPQEQSAEQIFEMVTQFINTGDYGLIVIDSYGVMMSQQAYDKTIEVKTYGGIAMALTQFSKKATMGCAKYNCTLIGINQVREDMNSQYGGTTTIGGKAWRHDCSVRLSFRKGDHFDEKFTKVAKSTCGDPYGHYVQMHVEKTKICRPDRKLGFYTFVYTTGIEAIMDYIGVALQEGWIKQGGAWFTFVDPYTGEVLCNEDGSPEKVQGIKNLPTFLKSHGLFYAKIKAASDSITTDKPLDINDVKYDEPIEVSESIEDIEDEESEEFDFTNADDITSNNFEEYDESETTSE